MAPKPSADADGPKKLAMTGRQVERSSQERERMQGDTGGGDGSEGPKGPQGNLSHKRRIMPESPHLE
ncbi:MAG: hypothetical protein FRX49_02022 [Trebouxia sp. A1-2]|nr:MAG: hypothetical protein FRX49_02022 [Trebouxia sp. A1-2]